MSSAEKCELLDTYLASVFTNDDGSLPPFPHPVKDDVLMATITLSLDVFSKHYTTFLLNALNPQLCFSNPLPLQLRSHFLSFLTLQVLLHCMLAVNVYSTESGLIAMVIDLIRRVVSIPFHLRSGLHPYLRLCYPTMWSYSK